MQGKKQMVLMAMTSLAITSAEAKPVEFDCDDGSRDAGYRMRVVEISKEIQEVIVLKKSRGSANVVESRKLKRVSSTPSGTSYEFNKPGHRVGLKKSAPDSDGNFKGTFTIPAKRGSRTVQATCAQVETLTM